MKRDSLFMVLGMIFASVPGAHAADRAPDPAKQQHAVKAYGQLPLSFTANQGQYSPSVRFQTRGSAYSISLASHEAIFSLDRPTRQRSHVASPKLEPGGGDRPDLAADVRMQFVGASDNVAVSGAEEMPGKANFLIGNDSSKWHTGVPTYAKVKYAGLYPGIDLVYYGNQKQLEFDFILQPGADPNCVKLRFKGSIAGKQALPRIDRAGDLLIGDPGREIRFPKPVVYQAADDASQPSARHLIDAGYVLSRGNEIQFRVGAYDKSKPLVIDPMLTYSTLIAGSGFDIAHGIAVDSAGNAYITGETSSQDFPVTANAFQESNNEGGFPNTTAFVTKLNSTGTALVYSTYLGGSDGGRIYSRPDTGLAIAVDASGNAFVYGYTFASDFPTTPGALQPDNSALHGGVFVSKLNPAGSGLIYSTLVPGALVLSDTGLGSPDQEFAIDSAGDAYVTGVTLGGGFLTTPGAYQTAYPGDSNAVAFLTKLNPTGSALIYSTYLGPSTSTPFDSTVGLEVVVDKTGAAYVAGTTNAIKFPTTRGALDTAESTDEREFLTKFFSPRSR